MEDQQITTLLAKVGNHDGEMAMRELYKAFSRKIYAYAFNQLGDQSAAKQIVVDTMYDVWRRPQAFEAKSKFDTWLIGIARHKVIDIFRTQNRYERAHVELSEELQAEYLDPLEAIEEKQVRDAFWNCINKLSKGQRECIFMVYYEGMTIEETAAIQKCSQNAVKGRLFQARKKIKPYIARTLQIVDGKR